MSEVVDVKAGALEESALDVDGESVEDVARLLKIEAEVKILLETGIVVPLEREDVDPLERRGGLVSAMKNEIK